MSIFVLQVLLGIMFLTIISLHLIETNFGTVIAYVIQSVIITLLLLNSFFETNNFSLLIVVLLTLIVKVILATVFFTGLIKRLSLNFSVSNYLSMPLTLIVIAVITLLAHSNYLSALTNIIPAQHSLLALSLAAIFMAMFLIVNRKDALFQAIGVLSLENGIVAFAIFAGLEQSPVLQIGIIFDILIWLVIATVFIRMIYQHFGSLDTSLMKHLKD
ncbi:MAG: hypothetical protein WCV88_04705 [Patescibacteria group bacterium]|jgi:hydrogenase-4 membrane subunit HyfE